jgi:hypothetical protein
LSWNQQKLLTGHNHFKVHLFTVGLVDSSGLDRCKQAFEMALRVLYTFVDSLWSAYNMASINLHWSWQLLYLWIWLICVSRAFTTHNESDGSMLASDDCRACVKLSTSSIRTHTRAWGSWI